MKILGPLYAKSSTGKTKKWIATIYGDGKVEYEHGYLDQKQAINIRISTPKNINKSNETSAFEQAILDATSKMNKKIDEGYITELDNLELKTVHLPMLANKYDERKHNIIFPAYVQPKLDGVRCLGGNVNNNATFMSRQGKQFTTLTHLANDVKDFIKHINIPNVELDGEIFVHNCSFQEIIRNVKKYRENTTELLEYWIYDLVIPGMDFEQRTKIIKDYFKNNSKIGNLVYVTTNEVKNETEIFEQHAKFTQQNFEGTIIRNKLGGYILKHRSNNLLKYKDFIDSEFEIVDGKEASGDDVGTVVFVCKVGDKTFDVRPKGSRELRREWLADIKNIIGKKLIVKYQKVSENGTPIFPVGICLRDYED